MKVRFLLMCGLCLLTILAGCTRYTNSLRDSAKHDGAEALSWPNEEKDSAPAAPVDVSRVPDAIPRVEKRTAAGNTSPYKVRGKRYRVLTSAKGYREKGVASWYGNKFHGRKTANGEIYNMFAMTAAHKTLPIPSYVRVTHLENQRSVVVRVNDRGPFHGGRIIDLSYAAAKKLDMLKNGTAKVAVEAIDPKQYQADHTLDEPGKTPRLLKQSEPSLALGAVSTAENPLSAPVNMYLQVGAFSSITGAKAIQSQIQSLTSFPVNIKTRDKPALTDSSKVLFRVHIGPLPSSAESNDLRGVLANAQLPKPHLVYY